MDLYIILGVSRAATLDDIKRAYKRLARKYHPDINPGDRTAAQQFRQISEAYETLSDPHRRQRYDTVGSTSTATEASSVGFEGFDFSVSVSGAAASTFGELFAEVFQPPSGSRTAGPERGADLHHTITLRLEEVMRGTTREIPLTRQVTCHLCAGRGSLRAEESRCARCQGSGSVRSARGHMVFSKPCPHCGGAGRHVETRCPACGGRQLEMRAEAVKVSIPPGLADGERIRVAGNGHAGRAGGAAGDLLLTVQVQPHDLFVRHGDDLHIIVPIAVHEAALGAKVDVPSFEGNARVRVPPGTQSGQRFRVRERGVPSAHGGGRGDLVVEVRLALPPVLDERSKELLREFGSINAGEDVRQEWPRKRTATGFRP